MGARVVRGGQATDPPRHLVPQRGRAAGIQYRLFYAPFARPAYRAARRFLVSSAALAEHAVTLQPYRDLVSVIPFGIDVDAWQPSDDERCRAVEIRRDAGRPIVLFAGRHVPYKGVPTLIEAAAPLDVSVVMLGDGPMRETWTKLAKAQRGRASYSFPGEVPDHELRAQLLASRMFVLPSVTRAEAFGYIQLEAMACGTAGHQHGASDRRSLGERIGCVVPAGDVGHSVAAIASSPLIPSSRAAWAGEVRSERAQCLRWTGWPTDCVGMPGTGGRARREACTGHDTRWHGPDPFLAALAAVCRSDQARGRWSRLLLAGAGRLRRPVFDALKFRSMRTDAEAGVGAVQAIEDDPRVTRIGRFMRRTAMDELPQLWNIFRGDMSFVGPRALRPGEVESAGGARRRDRSDSRLRGAHRRATGADRHRADLRATRRPAPSEVSLRPSLRASAVDVARLSFDSAVVLD